MLYSVDEFKKAVRITLDHNEVYEKIDGIVDDVTTLGVDEIIGREVIPAARQVILMSPRDYVEWKRMWGADLNEVCVNSSEEHMMRVRLPYDYVRFGYGKLSNWNRGVGYNVNIGDAEYEMQFSRFAGIRATVRRPLIAIVDADCGMEVQMFPCDDDSKIVALTYAAEPAIKDGKIEISSRLYEATVYVCAALVAEVLKDTEKSNQMMAVAKNMLTNVDDVAKSEAVQQQGQ